MCGTGDPTDVSEGDSHKYSSWSLNSGSLLKTKEFLPGCNVDHVSGMSLACCRPVPADPLLSAVYWFSTTGSKRAWSR